MSSRNKLCTCGSGKLYRKCCGKQQINVAKPGGSHRVTLPNGEQFPVQQVIEEAMSLHRAGRVQRAAELYRSVLAVKPRHADALHLLGVVERQLGNLPQAVELIRTAITINPQTAMYHSNLGQAYCAQGLAVNAEASCRRAIELDSVLPEAYLNLGNALKLQHKAVEALEIFEQVLRLRPNYIDALLAKGDVLHEAGKHTDALECYRQIIALQPDSTAGLTRVGINLRVQGRSAEAIAHYQAAIQCFPKIPELHHNLAIVFHRLGQLEDAIASMRCVLALTPDDTIAQHLLATYEGRATASAPAEYVRDLFDAYAETFENHLVQKLGYSTPDLLLDAMRSSAGLQDNLSILDLGCGTGLMGVLLHAQCTRLVGIDISPKMVEKAREKGIYTELLAADILPYLQSSVAGNFDWVVAADVFVYVGVLDSIFTQVKRVVKCGGFFAFSVEALLDDEADFVLDATGRYRHSAAYLRRLTTASGLLEIHFASTIIRYQEDRPVQGYLCVLAVPVISNQ